MPRATKAFRGPLVLVACLALCLGFAFLAAVLLASCSASVSSAIKADGGAAFSVQIDVVDAVAAKIRKLAEAGGSPQGAADRVFDQSAIRTSIATRPYLSLTQLSSPAPGSLRLAFGARSLRELAEAPDIAGTGLISVTPGPSWTECRFRLDRGNAKVLEALFPSIDPGVLEALSPPALDPDPVTASEYRSMLKSLFGEKSMPAFDAAAVSLSISVPGTILDSGGGSLSGSTLSAKIPLLQAMVLEKPIEVWVRWANR